MISGKIPNKYSHVILVTGSRTWADVSSMRTAFNRIWLAWDPALAQARVRPPLTQTVTRPLLISGDCPSGADAMAQRLWYGLDLEVLLLPADWSKGRDAGFIRNQYMVDAAQVMRDAGAQVVCTAFLDACTRPTCQQRHVQQLVPEQSGHFSHGTVHCRSRALAAGLDVHDVIGQPAEQR